MESRPYGVALVPEQTLIQEALKLSKQCESRGTHFTLDEKSFFSHLSLYMLQLEERGLLEAMDRLSLIANDYPVVRTEAHHYNFESGYFDIEYSKTDAFTTLQEKILGALNPVRDGLREKDRTRLVSAEGEERDNILKYGYRSVGNKFFPHLTFTRFITDTDAVENLPPVSSFTGSYPSLALFELGDNGTCIRLVKSWQLKLK